MLTIEFLIEVVSQAQLNQQGKASEDYVDQIDESLLLAGQNPEMTHGLVFPIYHCTQNNDGEELIPLSQENAKKILDWAERSAPIRRASFILFSNKDALFEDAAGYGESGIDSSLITAFKLFFHSDRVLGGIADSPLRPEQGLDGDREPPKL